MVESSGESPMTGRHFEGKKSNSDPDPGPQQSLAASPDVKKAFFVGNRLMKIAPVACNA